MRASQDRNYVFYSLGSFADKPSMRYLLTSNDDKGTPADLPMWRLNIRMPVVVYLNFRSERHAAQARTWLRGWTKSTTMESTVSSGIPNGPYHGPIYYKAVDSGTLDLNGSHCGEGTYFVFVDVQPES
ncbi:unnamed protein product [Effrenium voratum]|nr:unnamed protein product [Effrenium voratum]